MAGEAVQFDITSDAAKAVRDMARMVAATEKMASAFQRVTRESKLAAGQRQKSIEATDRLTSALSRYISVGAGISLVTAAFRKLNEEAKRGSDIMKTDADWVKKILEISSHLPQAQIQERLAKVTEISRQTGMTRAEAGEMVFTALSEGQYQDINFFAGLSKFSTDALSLLKSATTLQATFGKEGAGTSREVVNQVIQAALTSRLTAGQLGPHVATVSAQASQAGIDLPSTLAALAVATKGTGSSEEAATALRAVATVAMQHGLASADKPTTYPKLIATIEQNYKAAEDLRKFVSLNIRAGTGINLVQRNRKEMMALETDVRRARRESGTDKDVTLQILRAVEETPQAAIPLAAKIQEARRIDEEAKKFGTNRILSEAVTSETAARLLKDDAKVGERLSMDLAQKFMTFLRMPAEVIQMIGDSNLHSWERGDIRRRQQGNEIFPITGENAVPLEQLLSLHKMQQEAAAALAESAKNLEKATRSAAVTAE